MSNTKVANIRNLFSDMRKNNPSSYEGIMQLLFYLEKQEALLFPIIDAFNNPPSNVVPENATSFNYTIQPNGVLFSWVAPSTAVQFYEIRLGTNWDTADFVLRTASQNAIISPLLVGSYTYLLKTLSSAGQYSETTLSVTVNIFGPSIVSLTAEVIDNNVLLYWSAPTTQFAVDRYVILRDGIEQGTTTSTFIPITMIASGTYTFGVYAVDIAGNVGPTTTLEATVSQPPDYVLQESFISNLDQTRVNCFRFV